MTAARPRRILLSLGYEVHSRHDDPERSIATRSPSRLDRAGNLAIGRAFFLRPCLSQSSSRKHHGPCKRDASVSTSRTKQSAVYGTQDSGTGEGACGALAGNVLSEDSKHGRGDAHAHCAGVAARRSASLSHSSASTRSSSSCSVPRRSDGGGKAMWSAATPGASLSLLALARVYRCTPPVSKRTVSGLWAVGSKRVTTPRPRVGWTNRVPSVTPLERENTSERHLPWTERRGRKRPMTTRTPESQPISKADTQYSRRTSRIAGPDNTP